MLKFENVKVIGFEPAIRGMRNPKNSWEKSDSVFNGGDVQLGPNDLKLALQLCKGGSVHAKFRRMIVVYVDITGPLYWWKEYDTYKVGTVANSCSTMHKIQEKEFTIDDFSHEHLIVPEPGKIADDKLTAIDVDGDTCYYSPIGMLEMVIKTLNHYRELYLATDDPELKKLYWWQMIQLLPSSYNQKRTVMLSYEVLSNMYHTGRKTHKLDEWRVDFMNFIDTLPYNELIKTAPACGDISYDKVYTWLLATVDFMTPKQYLSLYKMFQSPRYATVVEAMRKEERLSTEGTRDLTDAEAKIYEDLLLRDSITLPGSVLTREELESILKGEEGKGND